METAEQSQKVTGTVDLLRDVITKDRQLPEGYDGWAIRTVLPDFRSQYNYRYPFPGQVAEAPGPFSEHHGGCPSSVGDGICAAKSWRGMASGGVPASTLLLVAYKTADLLGSEDDGNKSRYTRFLIVDVIDGAQLVRTHGRGADLRGADLRGANLCGAVNLSQSQVHGALTDRWTQLPSGPVVPGLS